MKMKWIFLYASALSSLGVFNKCGMDQNLCDMDYGTMIFCFAIFAILWKLEKILNALKKEEKQEDEE